MYLVKPLIGKCEEALYDLIAALRNPILHKAAPEKRKLLEQYLSNMPRNLLAIYR